MRTRVIFLDIDGVLHPSTAVANFAASGQAIGIYAEANDLMRWNEHLSVILKEHDDVMLVVHSSWRMEFAESEIRALLGPLSGYFQGVTHRDHAGRYNSILQLVERAQFDDYLILDDATREFPDGCAELVVCDPLRGVSDPAVQARVRSWLEATCPTITA